MTHEEQARDLLERASQLPGELTPPVQRLIQLGRRRRKLRSAQRMLAVGVVAVLAAVTPHVIGAINVAPASGGRGPTGAQIAKFRWSALPPSPLGHRNAPLLTATGRYLIELGGSNPEHGFHDGAVFDLKTKRWHKIAAAPGDVLFYAGTTVWTGRELFVTDNAAPDCPKGKPTATSCQSHAGLYNPVTNRWKVTQLPAAMKDFGLVAGVWTGRVVVLAALNQELGRLVVTAYNPSTGRWQIITPHLPAGHPVEDVQLVATSNRLILWSDWSTIEISAGRGIGVDVRAFDEQGANPIGRWRNLSGSWPQTRYAYAPVVTGNSILIPPSKQPCASSYCSPTSNPGFFVSAKTLRRTSGLPTGPLGSSYIWADRTIIAAKLGRGTPLPYGLTDLSDYDPGTHKWRRLAAVAKGSYTNALPVWTGRELLVVTTKGDLLALHR